MQAHSQPAGSQRQAGEVTVDLGAGAPQATPPATASGDRPLFEDGGDGAAGDSQAGAGTPSRRQVLDDVDWGVVSSRVGTRSDIQCLEKWYSQLCPSMVERGEAGRSAVATEAPCYCTRPSGSSTLLAQAPWNPLTLM